MIFTYKNMHTYEATIFRVYVIILQEFLMLEKSLRTSFNIVEHLTKVVEKSLRTSFTIVEHLTKVEDTNIKYL